MISIRKYLDHVGGGGAPAEPGSTEALLSLCTGLLEGIHEHVLTGEQSEGLRSQLLQLRDALGPTVPVEEAAQAEESTRQILASHQARVHQAATDSAVEIQHILGMLNQALQVLAGGSERSVSRLQKIEKTLQRASMIEDIVALKASLAETVRFVKEEAVREQETSSAEVAGFEKEVGKARELAGRSRGTFAGRPEGIRDISVRLKSIPADQALYLVAFHFDRLQAVVQRYGPEVADELMLLLIKERLQPVAASNATYRWTASSLVGLFHRPRDLDGLRTEMARLNRAPLVYRLPLGNRTAVLTVSPSHLVAEGRGEQTELLIEEVDRFTGLLG
jgi:hypothetical protein